MVPFIYVLICLMGIIADTAIAIVPLESDMERRKNIDCIPIEVHLALSESTDELRLVWVTTAEGWEGEVCFKIIQVEKICMVKTTDMSLLHPFIHPQMRGLCELRSFI